jgi:hypothetical protein
MEIKKLEPKHIIPYLPFGLKFLYNGNIYKMRCINRFGDIDYDSQNDFIDPFPPNIFNKELDLVKLMFRPLSEFQEEKIEEIKEFLGLGEWCDHYDQYFEAWFDDAESVQKLVLQCPYEIIQWFFKNHYDVFGLIPAGLAIDINTLNLNK